MSLSTQLQFRVSADLCTTADDMANVLDDQTDNTGSIVHNESLLDTLSEGENLYSGKFTGNQAKTVQEHMFTATDLWQNEDQWWTHGDVAGGTVGGSQGSNCNAPAGDMCGHYTQHIWKATTHVCYSHSTGPDGWEYIVARYKPRGNILEQYTANVTPGS